jgi:hypothetical protein
MFAITIAMIGFASGGEQFLLRPDGAYLTNLRSFQLPLIINPEKKPTVKRVRFFLSLDKGASWTHQEDYKGMDRALNFKAHRDGEFWIALQVEHKDGSKEPANKKSLKPQMKVHVATGWNAMLAAVPHFAENQRKGLKIISNEIDLAFDFLFRVR